jgi:hypothetical protein
MTSDDDRVAAGSRLGRVRPRSLGARPGIRWCILHGRSNYADLLPSGLSGATRSLGECRVLWFGRRRGASRLPPMPSLPTRDGTGKPGVERDCNDGGARNASYRGRIPGRSLGRRTCRSPRCWATPLVTSVSPPYGCASSEIAATRRVQIAKRLIDQTTMGLSDIAFAAGFRSVRRFNDAFRATYGRPPSSFSRGGAVAMSVARSNSGRWPLKAEPRP